ncbi:[citrate (pro-3S)-lyase] ligase [Photobacterium sanguinicancri]|uniref:[citrate (pro-3S)-lyase] ligase n=1 Tax=Photobacterium sanguinicancri TaxID=875932 RepID=UPI0021C2CD9B|nr:[citrate (pro-3S)-lyase] ligase [Photobacterium sanguinicancri]
MKIQIATINADSVLYKDSVKYLIESQGLNYEDDLEYYCTAHDGSGELIGCVGLAGTVIKCFAIRDDYQGEGISRSMMTEIILLAYQLGRKSLSIFTSPDNVAIFESMRFQAITSKYRRSVLLINRPDEIITLQHQLHSYKVTGNKIGSIVMNANPFTKGHAYLIEKAASECDWVHIFVVRENNQAFSFKDRFSMVKNGTLPIPNLTLHAGNDFMISKRTFPSYFLKESGNVHQVHAEIDCELFANYIAPSLGITHRYIGSEPNCKVTENYNSIMKTMLQPHIEVVEFNRLLAEGCTISASTVRNQLSNAASAVASLLPVSTINYLVEHCGYALHI